MRILNYMRKLALRQDSHDENHVNTQKAALKRLLSASNVNDLRREEQAHDQGYDAPLRLWSASEEKPSLPS